MAKLVKNGEYGQLELNQVSFPRTGRIEAQCALDTSDFSEANPAENGMILVVDNVTRTIKKTKTLGGAANEIFALNYSAEHMYDDRDLGQLRKFKLVPGTFYPRLGFLSIGEKFTTNTVAIANLEAIELGAKLVPGTDGYWTPGETGNVIAQVIKKTTMPDGQPALKLQVVKA